jgi:hypothetical protein
MGGNGGGSGSLCLKQLPSFGMPYVPTPRSTVSERVMFTLGSTLCTLYVVLALDSVSTSLLSMHDARERGHLLCPSVNCGEALSV